MGQGGALGRLVEGFGRFRHDHLEADPDLYDRLVEGQPMLVRISAAKQLRDRAERRARDAGHGRVSAGLVAENLE